MSTRYDGVYSAVVICCIGFQCPTIATGVDITYELLPESVLTHEIGISDRHCGGAQTFEIPLTGTFVLSLTQSEKDVGGTITSIDFHGMRTQEEYNVTGSGSYIESLLNNSPAAEPPNTGFMSLGLKVNDIPPAPVSHEPVGGNDAVFPAIKTGLLPGLRSRRDCFWLAIRARPVESPTIRFFRRGDVNVDGQRSITDALIVIRALFQGSNAVECDDAADVNDDGKLDISDAVSLLTYLFQGGALPMPIRFCGTDPTSDELTCANQGVCFSSSV